jgi:ABC-type lipoprotein export system ATPase subunit
MLFSANDSTRAFGLGDKHDSADAFIAEFKTLKACVHGSDAHSAEDLFKPAERRYLWIRADPTFQGLRQLLHEPRDRGFIGEEPPSLGRLVRHATKYLERVQIKKVTSNLPDEVWFDNDLLLNPGLVAIIGNKGSGKSALADVIALLGDSRAQRDFSFLDKDRFLAPKQNLGEIFEATLAWRSKDEQKRKLSAEIDVTAPERVKYIPQNYLEKVCTELRESSDTEFDRELQDVIFSHVADADRLGQKTLPELLAYRTAEKEATGSQLLKKLEHLNRQIVEFEDQLTEEHRKRIEGQLAQREAELKTHEDSKPAEVPKPAEEMGATMGLAAGPREELAAVVRRIEDLDKSRREAEARLSEVSLRIAAADRLLERIANLESTFETFRSDSLSDAALLEVDIRQIVTLEIDRASIAAARAAAAEEQSSVRKALDPGHAESVISQRQDAATEADALRNRLDEPNRKYEQYLQHLAAWEKRRTEIVGAEDVPGSVRALGRQLEDIETIPTALDEARAARIRLVADIFRVKEDLLGDYMQLYSPVQQFIDEHPVSQETDALQFSASITVDAFAERLLAMVHQGRRGSFQGDPDGRERLSALLQNYDLGTLDGVETFVSAVEDHLTHDVRLAGNPPTELRHQLRQGVTPEQIYDFVFGLTYLRPRFELRWRGKTLDQLSPGERGTLLLIFYLLIDRRDITLVIDQPEENLDNETITMLLVPAIKYAKDRRQIIIVTHNPNLAVVCDADQVVHASIDKTAGNQITYTAGSIEDPAITELIVDVLEGTKPAFDLRDAKYDVLDLPQ